MHHFIFIGRQFQYESKSYACSPSLSAVFVLPAIRFVQAQELLGKTWLIADKNIEIRKQLFHCDAFKNYYLKLHFIYGSWYKSFSLVSFSDLMKDIREADEEHIVGVGIVNILNGEKISVEKVFIGAFVL